MSSRIRRQRDGRGGFTDKLRKADFVLLICTEIYLWRMTGREQSGQGHGAPWESLLIYQYIYNAATRNPKFIPILLEGGKFEYIPTPLQGATHYRPNTKDGYEALYRRLTGQPRIRKPPRGTLQPLPPENLANPEKRENPSAVDVSRKQSL